VIDGGDEGKAAIEQVLCPPCIVVWSGHMFHEKLTLEEEIKAKLKATLADGHNRIGYGSLAAGSDIVIAEAMLELGAEINIVLPFLEDEFIESSVRPYGCSWISRFLAVLERASSVTLATVDRFVDDPGQFAFGSDVTLGLAQIRADALLTKTVGLVVWDEVEVQSADGTGADVRKMRENGLGLTVVRFPGSRARRARDRPRSGPQRCTRSFIFTDLVGFSGIDEKSLPTFWHLVMASAADVLDEHRDHIDAVNTWGDAVYAVVDSPAEAASIATRLAFTCSMIDPKLLGLQKAAGMRISVHAGPAYLVDDPITRRRTAIGGAVNLAARVEPVATVGSVFATAPFAALLRLKEPGRFMYSYLGLISLPKGYGQVPVFDLKEK
jgi:class 3 adenylate cyclase